MIWHSIKRSSFQHQNFQRCPTYMEVRAPGTTPPRTQKRGKGLPRACIPEPVGENRAIPQLLRARTCWPTIFSTLPTLMESLQQTLESHLDSKIKPLNPKGNQPWVLIGGTEAEAQILWPPDGKGQLIGKDCDAGKDWRQKEGRAAEGKLVGWPHRLDEHESEKTLEDSERREAWHAAIPGAAKSQTLFSNWTNNNSNQA